MEKFNINGQSLELLIKKIAEKGPVEKFNINGQPLELLVKKITEKDPELINNVDLQQEVEQIDLSEPIDVNNPPEKLSINSLCTLYGIDVEDNKIEKSSRETFWSAILLRYFNENIYGNYIDYEDGVITFSIMETVENIFVNYKIPQIPVNTKLEESVITKTSNLVGVMGGYYQEGGANSEAPPRDVIEELDEIRDMQDSRFAVMMKRGLGSPKYTK